MSKIDYQLQWAACKPGDYGDFGGDSIVILRGNSTRRLCVVHGSDEEAIAAARLIKSAPDLLRELDHVCRWFDQLGPKDIERYRAVVAKANGEEP